VSRRSTSFILGYHGCDRSIGERALSGAIKLTPSREPHDWLGSGIYFWEGDPQRAAEWARVCVDRGKVSDPFVIGAVIDLGNCLDLTHRDNIDLLSDAFQKFKGAFNRLGEPLPKNTDPKGLNRDKLFRYLDNAVINYLHDLVADDAQATPYDTVRGLFVEGKRIYPGAGFHKETHTQIAVRTASCIKGLFRC